MKKRCVACVVLSVLVLLEKIEILVLVLDLVFEESEERD